MADAAQFNKKGQAGAKSFIEKLDSEALNFFNQVASKPFSQQATAFLNAYWPEVKDEAEFIYSVAWDKVKYADMHFKGIQLVYSTYKQRNFAQRAIRDSLVFSRFALPVLQRYFWRSSMP